MSRTPYEQGYLDGLTAYAVMRNGVYYIGNDRPLRECVQDVHDTWNFNPPEDNSAAILTALKSALPIIGATLSEARDGHKYGELDIETVHDLQKIYDDAEAAIGGAV